MADQAPRMCGHCRFFSGNPIAAGRCHRHAPKPVTLVVHPRDENRFEDPVSCSVWFPEVDAADWCGEYDPANKDDL